MVFQQLFEARVQNAIKVPPVCLEAQQVRPRIFFFEASSTSTYLAVGKLAFLKAPFLFL
jgi:hypothetical protein